MLRSTAAQDDRLCIKVLSSMNVVKSMACVRDRYMFQPPELYAAPKRYLHVRCIQRRRSASKCERTEQSLTLSVTAKMIRLNRYIVCPPNSLRVVTEKSTTLARRAESTARSTPCQTCIVARPQDQPW